MSAVPLADKVVALDRALEEAGTPHAFGGALALAYYAEPRATVDIDVNIFAPPQRFGEVADALAPLGVSTDVDRDAVERDGQCRLWWERNPVDLFFAYDPLHEAMAESLHRVPFGEATIPILSPEHLAVCKAVFDRAKDWIDLEQMLVGEGPLDLGEVREWLVRIVGEDDPRLARLDELVSRR